VYVSTNNGMKPDPPSQMLLIFGNLSSSSINTHETQEERSRLSGTAYGDINSNSLSIGS